MDASFRTLLEQVEARIITAFKIALQRMVAKLGDRRHLGARRPLDLFEQTNADEHRLMPAQIDELDSRLPPRRTPRRGPS
jgi:hypothetical protein